MYDMFSRFEKITRQAGQFSQARISPNGGLHPLDERNIHPCIVNVVRNLFDNGHFSQATFEAYKYVDKEVQRLSYTNETGVKLMMQVFAPNNPTIRFNLLQNDTELDEQKGFQFIFAGSVMAIRNPRGHDYGIIDTQDKCLDHLALASMLIRRLEEAGYK